MPITNAMAIAIDCNKFEFIDSNRHCNRIRLNNPSFLVLCRFAALRRFVSIGPLHTQAMWEAIIREHLGSFSTELCHSMFGVEISVINHLYSLLPGHFLPVYLLWTLYFLKNYPVAEVAAANKTTCTGGSIIGRKRKTKRDFCSQLFSPRLLNQK